MEFSILNTTCGHLLRLWDKFSNRSVFMQNSLYSILGFKDLSVTVLVGLHLPPVDRPSVTIS